MRWLKQWCCSHLYDKLSPNLFQHGTLQLPPSSMYCSGASGCKESSITRDWLVQLWHEEKKRMALSRRTRTHDRNAKIGNEEVPQRMSFTKQPPVSQFVGDYLAPTSSEEVKLALLLARANLLITREIEWANIMFAFEQDLIITHPGLGGRVKVGENILVLASRRPQYLWSINDFDVKEHKENKYAILDPCYPGSPVGHIREQSNVIFRQLLRSRRPFIAHITDAMGNEIFRVRRPFWLINSTIYAEVDGKEIGVVHRRWHLWKRIYDLYLGNKQFAVVENPGFWNWTFTLKDEDDKVLAQIDRDWRGVGFELFTDAGQYVIRFGDTDSSPKIGLAAAIQELEVTRPLTLSERAVAVALAVSLDNDYFSRRGGWGLPLLIASE